MTHALAKEGLGFDFSDTTSLPPLGGERVTSLREPEVSDEEASPAIDPRVAEYLERIELSVSPYERAELLEELGDIFERDLDDIDRALTARLMAYGQVPCAEAWSKLDELAGVTGRWSELAEEEAAAAGKLPAGDRERGWIRVARCYEETLHDSERAIECYREALAEDGTSEAGIALLALLRRCDRISELVVLLRRRLACAGDEEAIELRREIAELSEGRLEAPERAIEQYEAICARCPGDMDALRALERLYREHGPIESHHRALWDLIGMAGDPRELVTLYRRAAVLCERLGDLGRAAECLEWVLSYEPGSLDAYTDLERIYCEDRRWPAAVDALTRHARVLENGSRASLLLRAAELAEKELGDPQTALDLYQKATDAGADDVETLARLARAAESATDFRSAVKALERLAGRVEGTDERLDLLYRAAELALCRLHSPETAAPLLERALSLRDDHVPTIAALARARSEVEGFSQGLALLSDALSRVTSPQDRVPLLLEAGRLCVEDGRTDQALDYYDRLLRLEPDHLEATARACDVRWEARRFGEAAPMLRRLAARATDDRARAELLVRLGEAARALGHFEEAESALEEASEIDLGGEAGALRALGETLIEQEKWSSALGALQKQGALEKGAGDVDMLYRLGLCCARLGDVEGASEHLTRALEADPEHRPSLILRAELCEGDARALVRAKRALLRLSDSDGERARLLGEIGDIYEARLGEPAMALNAYLEALDIEPTRRQPIFRCFELLAALERWEESLEYLEQLIALEQDARYRARYRHTAGVICRDVLERADQAEAHFKAALEDDVELDVCLQDLEQMLAAQEDWDGLRDLYCAALRRLAPSGPGEKTRAIEIWSKLGELCISQSDRESGLTALQVAARLDPGDLSRHERITDLCIEAGPDHFERAIEHQQAILDIDQKQVGPYYALARLYRETLQDERARACLDAARVIESHGLVPSGHEGSVGALVQRDRQIPAVRRGALTSDCWARLRHPCEDALLGELFAAAAPAVALWQARPHAHFSLDRSEAVQPGARHPFARAAANVVKAFGVAAPELYARPTQRKPILFAHCASEGEVAVAMVLGRPLVAEGRTVAELEFALALQTAYLVPERWLRLLLPKPAQLAHVIEAACSLADTTGTAEAGGSRTQRLLERNLSPAALDHVAELGRRLKDCGVESHDAASRWLRGSTLTALRASLVFAPRLDSCLDLLEAQEVKASPEARERWILTLCRQSVASAVLDAREQLRSP